MFTHHLDDSQRKCPVEQMPSLRTAALVLCLAGASAYSCSESDPCASAACASKASQRGWICDSVTPVKCGACKKQSNLMIKCDEVDRKPPCRGGHKCVTLTATCVVGAGASVRPYALALLLPLLSVMWHGMAG